MSNYRDPGMRRVRLLLWRLYYRTPLEREIGEAEERIAAVHCRLPWDDYTTLKARHIDLWKDYADRRAQAKKAGGFRPMPPQFRRYRDRVAAARAKMRRARPRLSEWAAKKLLAQRRFKRVWLRHRVLDRLLARMTGH